MAAMITIANANALHIPLPDQSVQCIVTSPPYFGLRDYGTARWQGGSAECDHIAERTVKREMHQTHASGRGAIDTEIHVSEFPQGDCVKCGAVRIDAQIGLEATPAAYVASIVAVMRECWRVLKDDGVLWLNIGDSYFSKTKGDERTPEQLWRTSGLTTSGGKMPKIKNPASYNSKMRGKITLNGDGLKPKDLIGIPWHVAFALQDDGWYLRQDIIWHKPNPMPESVTDRCTKAHEYIFLLTKRARYYYDAEAIKEEITSEYSIKRNESTPRYVGNKRNPQAASDFIDREYITDNGRNRRSVWTVATSPYSGAHFATFPPALIEPMILAASRRGDVIFDPFAGSGTTGAVAVKHGRRAVLLDLNTKYIDLMYERTNGVQMTLPG